MPRGDYFFVRCPPSRGFACARRGEDGSAVYRKELAYPGRFTKLKEDSDEVEFELPVKEQTLDHWVRMFNRMKHNGIEVPVPLGHTTDPEKRRGTVVDIRKEPSENPKRLGQPALFAYVRFNDEPTAKQFKNSDVSLFMPPQFADGKGRRYIRPIRHVAITDYPVIPGLDPFKAVAASFELSLSEDSSMAGFAELAQEMGVDVPEGADDDAIKEAILQAWKAGEEEGEGEDEGAGANDVEGAGFGDDEMTPGGQRGILGKAAKIYHGANNMNAFVPNQAAGPHPRKQKTRQTPPFPGKSTPGQNLRPAEYGFGEEGDDEEFGRRPGRHGHDLPGDDSFEEGTGFAEDDEEDPLGEEMPGAGEMPEDDFEEMNEPTDEYDGNVEDEEPPRPGKKKKKRPFEQDADEEEPPAMSMSAPAPIAASLVRREAKNRKSELSALVRTGRISPACANALAEKYCHEQHVGYALSLETFGDPSDDFEDVVAALSLIPEGALSRGEQTGRQQFRQDVNKSPLVKDAEKRAKSAR